MLQPASTPPLIVFDLDGTLVDSAPDLVAALNTVIGREGVAPLPLDKARKFVGKGGRVLLRRGLEAQGRSVTDSRLEEMFAAFLAEYESHISARTLPYPSVEAALERLAKGGHRLAVCTNKFERPARMLLDALGMSRHFAAIVGADTFPMAKPDPAVLRLTIERAGGDVRRAVMVGDTITDVTVARNADLPVVCVDFGYAPETMDELAPDRVIGHFDELDEAVAALTAALPAAA